MQAHFHALQAGDMNHYLNWSVRARIAEFLGAGPNGASAKAVYIASADEKSHQPSSPRALSELGTCLHDNLEIFRSLWDRESLLVDLDIGYINFDDAAQAYTGFERTFTLQEPLRKGIERALLSYGITPLHLLSGRGHHFLWRIRRNSVCFERLAGLERLPLALQQQYRRTYGPSGDIVDPALGKAFAGLGQVIEFFAAEMKRLSAPESEVPIELSAIEVGPGESGREMISFDISQYGDPLPTRYTRVAYSRHLRMPQWRGAIREEMSSDSPILFAIPLFEMNLSEALQAMHDPKAVIKLASYAPAKIPDCAEGTENLLNSYLSSNLALFHCDYYAEDPEPPERWPETYDRMDLDQLPSCTRFALENPNPLLLRPAYLRKTVLTLLSLGWHPRHISGLIRSRFERDFGWGNYWSNYDPTTRAEFFTRVFAGLVVANYDDLVDFNCCSAQEEKLCLQTNCQYNLERFKTSLLNRRAYGRLARRPFQRLFLPSPEARP
jgi:hypothetical protein